MPELTLGEIAERLSEAQREAFCSIAPSFGVGDVFRLDEGVRRQTFSALVARGVLSTGKYGGFDHRLYWLTALGLAVRAHLMSKEG